MKRIKLLATFVLMIITIATFAITAEAATGIINEEAAKLRKAPESKTVLDLLNKGDEVEILEEDGGWYKVKAKTSLGKVTGYVSAEVLNIKNDVTAEDVEKPIEEPVEESVTEPIEKPTEPQENESIVSTETKIEEIEENKEYTLLQEVSIKALPLMSSREKAKISGNIKILETLNDWSRIENNEEIGWLRTNTLEKSLTKVEIPEVEQPNETIEEEKEPEKEQIKETEEPEEEAKVTEMNQKGYVNAEGLRVRSGPSTDTEAITSLSKNDEVKIIGQTGNWYKIDLDGKNGYVSAKYISDTKIVETTSRGGNTLKNETNAEQTEQKVEETPVVEEQQPVVEEKPVENVTSTTGNAIVEYAKQYLGYKYVSGGASPAAGFDCSGFTTYVYKHFGVSLYRTSRDQIKNGVAVEKSDLQPGDLVVFNNESNTAIGHVGIYVGDGNFIHASNPSDGVKITTLTSGYYKIRYVGARRVI